MAVKKRTFTRNGRDDDEAPSSIKVRTTTHADAKSLQNSAKQMPSVRLTFKEGEARTVRFLHEPFDRKAPWIEYYEHYVPGSGGGNGAYVPCIDNCRLDGDIRAGKRWYVNVWDRDSKQVRLLKLTGAMVENLIIKYERRGTIMDRDYSITRTGEGTDTKYHIEAEEKERFDQRNIKLIDILGYLDQQAQAYYGGVKSFKARSSGIEDEDEEDIEDTEEDEDEEEAPRRGKAKSRQVPDDDEEESDDDDDDDDDEEDAEPKVLRTKAGGKRKAVEEDEDEDEDVDDDDEADEDEEEEAPRRKTTKVASRPTATTKRPLGRRR